MYYELALISVLVAGGYWGWYFARDERTRLYGILLVLAAGLSGLGLLGERFGTEGLGAPGAVGVGAGACLLVVGPLTRGLARRLAAAERFGAAQRMLDVAEILAPGSGVAEEKALLYAMREIRDGNIDHTVDALTAAKHRAPAEARLAIDERIAMLYLASYRWDEAIAHAEQHMFDVIATEPTGDVETAEQVALRRALGIAPPVYVELLGAYGYKGDLDRAAKMLARLEEVCAGRPDAGIWLHRGRLMFLALAGRVTAVRVLVEPRRSRHMKPAARTYWVAVAHERQGAVAEAKAAYTKARARSRGRPRALIDQALERLSHARRAELGPAATEVLAQVEAQPPPVVTERLRPRGPVATRILSFAILAYAAVIAFGLDGSTDVGTLTRAGALVRGLVDDGEIWRLVTFSFVHVGGLHLVVNVLGLWALGRLAEELFGPWRTAAIFGLAGVGSAAASYFAVPAGISAGASGALFGVLGAVLVELSLHRDRHRGAWNRGVWGSLAVVTVAQIGVGFVYPVTDQWAHGAGLAIGALAAVVLSPHVRFARLAEYAARAITVAFALVVIASVALVAHTSVADSLERSPQVSHQLGTVTATAPAAWQAGDEGEIYDPDLAIALRAARAPASDALAKQLDAVTAAEIERIRKDLQLEHIVPTIGYLVPLPPGWLSRELVGSLPDPLGGIQRFRIVVAARRDPAGTVLASLFVPEMIVADAPAFFSGLLASLQ